MKLVAMGHEENSCTAVSVVVCFHSSVAAVDADYLSIDPATLWAGEKRDNANDIFDLTKPSEGSHLADGCDQLLTLPVQKQFSRDRPWRNRIDGGLALSKFIRQDTRETFDACLRRDIGPIRRETLAQHTA